MHTGSDCLPPLAGDNRQIASSNAFGLRLLGELVQNESDGNIAVSPCSLALLLAMLSNGAQGATRQAIADTLGLQGDYLKEVNQSSAEWRALIDGAGRDFELGIANAVWVREGIKISPSFVGIARRFYSSEVASMDFADPGSVLTVNEWVRRETRGKIDSILDASDLSSSTGCVLSSAIYFKGSWETPFDRGLTKERPFTLPDGQKKNVPMMSRSGQYAFSRRENFEAVCLPYSGGHVSMYIFLPAEGSHRSFIDGLSIDKFEDWAEDFSEAQLEIALPKLKLNYDASLKSVLSKLGMGVAFGDGADFSPMGMGGHHIEKFYHKTVLEVDEQGTEAASASAAILSRALIKPIRITIDRAFFWAIRDNRNHALLFVGSVAMPYS